MHKLYRGWWLFSLLWLPGATIQATSEHGYRLEKMAEGFSFVTAIVQAEGDDSRLFVADLKGKVFVLKQGILLDTPFLEVSSAISTVSYGQGLHNLAFHPDYAENGYLFVAYTQTDGNAALVRFHVSDNPDVAEAESAKTILVVAHPTEFHYGGGLVFGPDGYLYWSMGDGATKRSPAQDFGSYLGGIVRLDVDGDPYDIPPDNPFVDQPNVVPELWAKGLRNPWRFSFDRQTGDVYIADVGDQAREEINFQPSGSGGANYGWNRYEGSALFKGGDKDGLIFPVVEYPHDNGNCSITGGYVYRGAALPELTGKYIFGDYCSGWLWSTYRKPDESWYTAELLNTKYRITTFGEDNASELYVGAINGVYRLVRE